MQQKQKKKEREKKEKYYNLFIAIAETQIQIIESNRHSLLQSCGLHVLRFSLGDYFFIQILKTI